MKWFLYIIFLFSLIPGNGQDTLSYEEKYKIEYQKRIRKSHINGFYIPKDHKDALRILDEIIEDPGKARFAFQKEEYAVKNVFFSFGRWLLVNWGLNRGSRLSANLHEMGLEHPDDMVWFLMITYHRKLNNRPLDIEALIKEIPKIRLESEEDGSKETEGHENQ